MGEKDTSSNSDRRKLLTRLGFCLLLGVCTFIDGWKAAREGVPLDDDYSVFRGYSIRIVGYLFLCAIMISVAYSCYRYVEIWLKRKIRNGEYTETLVTGQKATFRVLYAAIATGGIVLAFCVYDIGHMEHLPPVYFTIFWRGGHTAVCLLFVWYQYCLWQILPRRFAKIKPLYMAGFLLIPIFNLYWSFKAYRGINRSLNRFADSHKTVGVRTSIWLATVLAALYIFLQVLLIANVIHWQSGARIMSPPAVNEYIGQEKLIRELFYKVQKDAWIITVERSDRMLVAFGFIPFFIVWLLMVLDQKRMIEHLVANNVPLNSRSNLLVKPKLVTD